MLVHKNKTETTDYNIVFGQEDIDLLHAIAAENTMEARALHEEPSVFDAFWFDHMTAAESEEPRSRIIPFHRDAVSYLIEKLNEYAELTEERAERAADTAPEGFADKAWFHRTLLGKSAVMFAAELDERFAKIDQTEVEAEARKVMAASATTADQWLHTLTEDH